MKIVERILQGKFWAGRDGHPVEAIVLHITDGDTASGAISWLARPSVDASAHYVIDKNGLVYRLVREEDTAWGNGIVNTPDMSNPLIRHWVDNAINPNRRTISIEIVGRPGNPLQALQREAVCDLVADICRRWSIAPSRETVIGHYQIDSVNRARCPGFGEDVFSAIINEARLRLSTFSVGPGILAAMKRNGDGPPLSDERYISDEYGTVFSVAATSRALYFWHKGADRVYRLPLA